VGALLILLPDGLKGGGRVRITPPSVILIGCAVPWAGVDGDSGQR
jgi:hypothetical protein